MTDRAVSDTVGFVLVFGLITTLIAVAFTGGMGALETAQTAERDATVERAFDVLHDDIGAIHREGVPSRTTEIKLAGGSLEHGERTEMRLENADGTVALMRSQPIVYSGAGDTEIAYEAGAVVRSDEGSSVMLEDPDLIIGERVLLPFVDLSSVGTGTIGGETTVLVTAERISRGLEATGPGRENVTLVIESERADAWKRYFESLDADGFDTVGREGDTVTVGLSPDIERIDVVRTEVETRFR